MKKSQLGDFFGFVMFFFIVIVMIVILSFFGVFNFNLTQKNSIEKDTSYSTTINSFLTQPLFPESLILGDDNKKITFLELLSYSFSTGDYSFFKDDKDLIISFMSLYDFKISFDGKDYTFSFYNDLKSFSSLKNYDCVPVSGRDFFYFPFDVYYYDEKGNLVSKRVVFSSIFDSDFGFLPLCVLNKKG